MSRSRVLSPGSTDPSASRSRPRPRHAHSSFSVDLVVPPAGEYVAAEAPISTDVADLLAHNFDRAESRSQSRLRDVLDAQDVDSTSTSSSLDSDESNYRSRPWYRRMLVASPWWILPATAISAVLMSMTMAPRTEVFIRLVCAELRPEFIPQPPLPSLPLPERFVFNDVAIPHNIYDKSQWHAENSKNWNSSSLYNVSVELLPSNPHHRTIPRPSPQCSSDPEVERGVAALQTIMSFITGVLAVLTVGWWGKLSDRVGRTRVLGFSVCGVLTTDIVFIATALYSDRLPGGYRFLQFGSLVDGLMGGLATASATAHAYVSDCTSPSARAQYFSLYLGLVFVGMALGPMVGGLLINWTGDLLSVFYIAATGHIIYALLIWFVMPESMSPHLIASIAERKQSAQNSHSELLARNLEQGGSRLKHWAFKVFSTLFAFLEPLTVFLPRKREIGESGGGWGGYDFNLTFIAVACAMIASTLGAVQVKFQYGIIVFGWTSEELGYWLTSVGIVRAVHLLLVLPLIIRYFGPQRSLLKDSNMSSPSDTQPLLNSNTPSTSYASRDPSLTPSHHARVTARHAHHSRHFDLLIARVSAAMDVLYSILSCISLTPTTYVLASQLASLGAGFNPTISSLALSLMPRGSEDAGRLFGAMGVLNAISAQVVGPALFGTTFLATVEFWPGAIFALSALVTTLATIALYCVRLPPREVVRNP